MHMILLGRIGEPSLGVVLYGGCVRCLVNCLLEKKAVIETGLRVRAPHISTCP
jgi:hypothetical protein